MKKLILAIASFAANFAFAANTNLYCQSADFNPAEQEGQALVLTFNETNQLTDVAKVAGSWFCDDSSVQNPVIESHILGVINYSLDFDCGEFAGMLSLRDTPAKAITAVTYEFSWDVTGDDYFRTTTNKLACVQQ